MISMAELMAMVESYYRDDLLSYVFKFSKEWERGMDRESEGRREEKKGGEREK